MMISAKANYTDDDAAQPQRENICRFDGQRVAGVYSVAASRQIMPGFSKPGGQFLIMIIIMTIINKAVQLLIVKLLK